MRRFLRRTVSQVRASLRQSAVTVRTPSLWPLKKMAAVAAATVAAMALAAHERSRAHRLQERRVFNEGSPLQSLESSLRTGDVLLFSRSALGIERATRSSFHPLRMLIVTLQKIAGRGMHDHVAIVIVRNDYPYILERNWRGEVTVSRTSQLQPLCRMRERKPADHIFSLLFSLCS